MNKHNLIQIIIDQNKEVLPSHLVPRTQYNQLLPFLNNKQILILSGIRRCGKSTLLQTIRNNAKEHHYYINFDDDRLVPFSLQNFSQLIEAFIELYGVETTFYFDEIQNIEGWERFVRRLHNEGKKVLITGSNATLLSSELGTHLTGRHIPVKLFPYSFREFLLHFNQADLLKANSTSTQRAQLKQYFSKYKLMGGMPEYLESNQKQYLHALYESIIYKDIIVRNKLPKEKPIKELVYYLASNNTKTFTYNSLKKLLGLGSSNTISEYCQYLENSYLCFILNRFSHSLKKQIHYAKKVYFIDTALAEAVGFRISEDAGRSLENIVFLQLKRQNKEIYFHSEMNECDFIIRDGYNISEAIQVCLNLKDPKTKKRELAGLLEAMELHGLSQGLIITEDEEGKETLHYHEKSYQIKIIPCYKWLIETDETFISNGL